MDVKNALDKKKQRITVRGPKITQVQVQEQAHENEDEQTHARKQTQQQHPSKDPWQKPQQKQREVAGGHDEVDTVGNEWEIHGARAEESAVNTEAV